MTDTAPTPPYTYAGFSATLLSDARKKIVSRHYLIQKRLQPGQARE